VDEQALAMFCAELATVLEAYDTTLTVLFHDTKVQKALTLTRMDMPASLAPVGVAARITALCAPILKTSGWPPPA